MSIQTKDASPPLERLVFDSCETAKIYMREALNATSNLPKGMNRTAIIVAFMEVAASDYRDSITLKIESSRGNDDL
jgi:hypothetical protein